MLARYRDRYQHLFSGLGKAMGKTGLTPNMLTALSLVPALISGYYFASGNISWGLVFIVVTALFDVLDGNVARATGRVSTFGKVFDHTIDRYAEFIIVGGLVIGDYSRPLYGMIALSGMIMASYIRAKAESEGAKGCDIGLMDRAEKLIFIMLGCLVFQWYSYSVEAAFVLVGVLSHITVIQRLAYAKKQFEVNK